MPTRIGSGQIVLPGHRYSPPHLCSPPCRPGAWTTPIPVPVDLDGAVWRCDCGYYWWAADNYWRSISARKARRLIRKAQK